MKNEIFNLFRASVFLFIITVAIMFCYVEKELRTSAELATESADAATESEPAPIVKLERDEKEVAKPTKPVVTFSEPKEVWTSLGTYSLTAYCSCEKCCGYWATVRPLDENGNPIVYTASGAYAEAGTTIAVDPRVIPYGSSIKINDHIYTAQDTGGAIKGNRIDVYFDDHETALQFGRKNAEVFILETKRNDQQPTNQKVIARESL